MSWSCTYLPGKSHEAITKDALCMVRDLDEAGMFALTLKEQYMAELKYEIDTINKTDNLKSKYAPSPSLERGCRGDEDDVVATEPIQEATKDSIGLFKMFSRWIFHIFTAEILSQ